LNIEVQHFFYEQRVDGKKYRIYRVNSIALLNLTLSESLSDVKKIIDITKQKRDINTLLLLFYIKEGIYFFAISL